MTIAFALELAFLACSPSSAAPDGGLPFEDAGIGDAGVDAGLPPAADPVQFVAAGPLHTARYDHTATLLASGQVLVIGGQGNSGTPLASVELYDPAAGSFMSLTSLPEGRNQHTATLLADGKVLIVGGGRTNLVGVPDGTAVLHDALVYDPATGGSYRTPPLRDARQAHTATLLSSGKVLVVGGGGDHNIDGPLLGGMSVGKIAVSLASAELYDPADNSWTVVGSLAAPRFLASAQLLADGRVLVVAGATEVNEQSLASGEIFDPTTNAFSSAGMMVDDRLFQSAAVLPSGKVLVTAGKKANIKVLGSTEIFDPAGNTWTVSAPLSFARTGALASHLQSGRVLVSGGDNCSNSGCSEQAISEIFDETTGQWLHGPTLAHGRGLQTQTVLPDGRLLIIGGVDESTALTLTEISQ